MVLSVPPLLEEMGPEAAANARRAMAAWQGELWVAAQWLRVKHGPQVDTRWMGTVAQLISEIGGSVLLGGDGEVPDVVPLSIDGTPTAKGSPADPLVRLEGAPGHSGRYVQLSVVIGSSVGIWPAVVTADGAAGTGAHELRGDGGRKIELQVVASGRSRLAFRLVDSESRAMISVSGNVEELAHTSVRSGPMPVPWAEFLERRLWGLPAMPTATKTSVLIDNGLRMRDMAALWGVGSLRPEQVPRLAIIAFLAAATGVPEACALANEIDTHWDEATDAAGGRLLDGTQLLRAADEFVSLMLPLAGSPAVLAAAKPAQALGAVAAAVYFGEVLLHSLTASTERAITPGLPPAALDSPRASRSQHPTAGRSTYLTVVETSGTPAASPRQQGRQPRKEAVAEGESDSEENLTPRAMRREIKRLRHLAAQSSSGAEPAGRKAARRSTPDGTASRAAPITLPEDLTDLSGEVRPAVSAGGRTPATNRSGALAARQTLLQSEDSSVELVAGPTMGECVQMAHTSEVRRLIPESADSTPLKAFGDLLDKGGMPDAPYMFAQAATTATTGIVPGKGTALEAEMLAANIAAVLDDLVLAKALPTEHTAFEGGVRPADWVQAAARGRALILATTRAFRAARQVHQTGGAASSSAEPATRSKPDKVPEDAYVKVSEATTNSLKVLAASAGVINSLTTDMALRGERLRSSPFESLTSHTREELDAALPGELKYFVDMYGQAATAYLVSNSRSLEEVSGRGVPAALVGIRRHLWSRAVRWVHEAYGERRATQRRVDVEKLALSLLAGAVPAEPVGKEGEKVIIELLGGSKPHKGAEMEREGGSTSTGTIGTLVGEAAQYSVRTAYRKWAKGLARCMGEVLLASRGSEATRAAVIGEEGDFGVEDALLNVPEDLPAESLRSIGRYLLEEVHVACRLHRSEPAAPLPDIVAIVVDMGGDVFKYRRQEHQLETLAQAAAAKLSETFAERLKAVEARQGSGSVGRAESQQNKKAGPSGRSTPGDKKAGAKPAAVSHSVKSEETAKRAGKQSRAAGVEMDDSALSSTAKAAARALEESMTSDSTEPFESKIKAVAALQAAYRKSVGSSEFRRLDEKEPCAWLALAGKCKDKKCKACKSGLAFDDAMLQAVRARCGAGMFGAGQQPAKEPG